MTERVCENCRFYWNLWLSCSIFQEKVDRECSCIFWGDKELTDKYEQFKEWLSNSIYTFIETSEMELIFEGQVFEHFEDYLEEQKDLIK